MFRPFALPPAPIASEFFSSITTDPNPRVLAIGDKVGSERGHLSAHRRERFHLVFESSASASCQCQTDRAYKQDCL